MHGHLFISQSRARLQAGPVRDRKKEMTYVSLYRKWRPQSFDRLVGQEHVAKTLANQVKADRVAHAYLFAGPRGTGKTSTAKILATSVNCQEGPTPDPCGKCESCRAIASGSSLDVLEMDAASNRGIEEIRELRERVSFAATTERKKVYIIDEVHMLTEPAFNALLKTIEEPPPHVIFVLATTDPNKVPATITSRCQHFEFRRIPAPLMIEHLAKIAKSEKIKVSDDGLAVIARHAEGSLRDAIGTLDQLSTYIDQKITEQDVATFLGLAEAALVEGAVDIFIARDAGAVFQFVADLIEAGHDLRQFASALLAHLRDLFILANVKGKDARKLLVYAGDEGIERLSKQADALGSDQIRSALSEVGTLYDEMRFAAEPRLALELALIRLIRGKELTLEALQRRVYALENGAVISGAPERATVRSEEREVPAAIAKEKPAETKKSRSAAPAATAADIETAWRDVLSQVKRKKLSLYAFLVEGRPGAVSDGTLNVIFGPKAVYASQAWEKPANASVLKEAISEALGQPMKFTISIEERANFGAGPEKRGPEAEPKDEGRPEEKLDDPARPAGDAEPVKAAKADENKKEEAAERSVAEVADEDEILGLLKENFGAEIVE